MKNGDALYLQIYQSLLNEIRDGLYEDARLPTEKEITERFFVSRITARRALDPLEDAGIVVRISGKGTFVRKGAAISSGPAALYKTIPMIALVMGGYGPSFGMDILNAVVRRAEEQRVHVIVKDTGNDQAAEFKALEALKQSGVDGIIVQPAHGETYSQWLVNAIYDRYPIVMIDRYMPGIDAPFVGVDDAQLAEAAVRHLLDAGHRNIALITLEDEKTSTLKARMDGFRRAMERAGIPINTDLWLTSLSRGIKREDKNTPEAHAVYKRQIARHMLRHPEITAIFGTEYMVSKLAMNALMEMGWHIPGDCSIVGFDCDGSSLGSDIVSHIAQPQARMGAEAVDMICAILRRETLTDTHRLIEARWVQGSTLAAPRTR